MRIFHIRRKLTRAKGNSFYRDRSDRGNGTYCGAPETEWDSMHNGKAEAWGDDHHPCLECRERRANENHVNRPAQPWHPGTVT